MLRPTTAIRRRSRRCTSWMPVFVGWPRRRSTRAAAGARRCRARRVSGPGRVDLRFAQDNAGELYVLTKSDGMIRQVMGLQ